MNNVLSTIRLSRSRLNCQTKLFTSSNLPRKSNMAPLLHHHHQQPFMKHTSLSFSSSSRSTKTKTIRIPPFPLVLIGLGLTCLGIGLYDHFLSDIQKYPTTVRTPLRKALYYERTDPQLALPYFEQAFQEALVEPTLEMNGAPLTGILIQWGTLLERLQRKNEARQVLILALRHLLGMEERLNDDIKMSEHNNEDKNKNDIDHQKGDVKKQLSDQDIFTFIDWTTLPPLEQKKVVGLCLKIGDLDVILHRDDEAEQYYVAAVEHLLKSSSKPTSQYGDHGEAVIFDKEHLPQWLTESDVGVALATLGQFYASKNKYRYAIELYLRALNLNGMNNCQASVFMNNLAESYVSLNQFNEAKHWAEKGINLAQNPNTYKVNNDKQVCDETCGVLLFNLGMIFEQMKEKEKAIQMYQQSIQHSRQHEQFMSVQEALKARKRVEFELARENQAKVA